MPVILSNVIFPVCPTLFEYRMEPKKINIRYNVMLVVLMALVIGFDLLAHMALSSIYPGAARHDPHSIKSFASIAIVVLSMRILRSNPAFQQGGFRILQFIAILVVAILMGVFLGALSYLG
jgi:hypothetical protein